MKGSYQMGYLTSADQEIPDWLVKISFLAEVETVNRLGIKSWFDGMDLAQVTPSWACCLFF